MENEKFAIKSTVVFSLMEFFLLRVLLRMGSFLPKSPSLDSFFDFTFSLGLASLNASLAFGFVAMGLFAFAFHRKGMRAHAFALSLVMALGLLSYTSFPLVYVSYQLVLLLAMGSVALGRKNNWVTLLSISLVCTFYYQLSLSLAPLGAALPFGADIFSLGEILAVATPILILPSLKRDYVAGSIAALFALAFLAVSKASFIPMFAVWTLYFTMILPSPIYAAAIFAFVYALICLLQNRRNEGVGLLLVGLGGRMFQNVYLTNLPVLGILMLAFWQDIKKAD